MARRLDPNTPPIGRQPDRVHITPSRSQPWYGAIVTGRRFTRQQEAELIKLGADIATAEAITVKRQATGRELWWPTGQLPPVYAFECPVILRRADGRVKVITPSGERKLVRADGWAHPPRRNPASGGF